MKMMMQWHIEACGALEEMPEFFQEFYGTVVRHLQ
jgi:hypothetical protein